LKGNDVTAVNVCKVPLSDVTQGEAEGEGDLPKEPTTRSAPTGFAVPPCFESIDGFAAALAGWIESRKKNRKPPTGRAIQLLINRLAQRPAHAIAALNEATERGWQTVKWEWLDKEAAKNGTPIQSELSKYRMV